MDEPRSTHPIARSYRAVSLLKLIAVVTIAIAVLESTLACSSHRRTNTTSPLNHESQLSLDGYINLLESKLQGLMSRQALLKIRENIGDPYLNSKPTGTEIPTALQRQRAVYSSRVLKSVEKQHNVDSQKIYSAYITLRDFFASLNNDYPGRLEYQTDLYQAESTLARLAWNAGDFSVARAYAQSALTITNEILADNEFSTLYLGFRYIQNERLGDIEIKLNNAPKAQSHYKKMIQAAQARLKLTEDDVEYLSDLSSAYSKAGDFEELLLDFEQAKSYFFQGLKIAQFLLEQNPKNIEYQRAVIAAQTRLGNATMKNGDIVKARMHLESNLRDNQEFVEQEPNSIDLQADLAISHNKVANIAKRSKDYATADQHYSAGLKIREQLIRLNPKDIQLHNALANSHFKLGGLRWLQNELDSAKYHFGKSLHIGQKTNKVHRGDLKSQRVLSLSFLWQGNTELKLGNLNSAKHHYELGLSHAQALAKENSHDGGLQKDVIFLYIGLGNYSKKLDKPESAIKYYQIAMANVKRILQSQLITKENSVVIINRIEDALLDIR